MALIKVWGILTILLILAIGILIGLVVTALGVLALRIGTLRIASDGESDPYLFLELDVQPTKLQYKHWGLIRIDPHVITPK